MHRPQMSPRSYIDALTHGTVAQMFAVLAGVVLTVIGVAALIVNADFGTGASLAAERFLVFDVNGWAGILYLVTGLAALLGSVDAGRAGTVAMLHGATYLVLTVWSLLDSSILGLLPVNDPTAVLYAAIAVVGIAAAMQPEKERAR